MTMTRFRQLITQFPLVVCTLVNIQCQRMPDEIVTPLKVASQVTFVCVMNTSMLDSAFIPYKC